ncbi:MAG TPA: CBS domain-containing protein [Stellaceae bacterium]|nr:CBS domain-containing protein [Stellaceae bacterium]
MKVHEVMSRDVETVRPTQSIKDVAQRMDRQGIGYFPVCDKRGLIGIITDRDITCRLVADTQDPTVTKVRDIMSKGVAYCFEDDDLSAAVQLMEQNRIRRIPVLDRNEHLVGILSLTDLARKAPHRLTAALVEAVSRESPLSVTIDSAAEFR